MNLKYIVRFYLTNYQKADSYLKICVANSNQQPAKPATVFFIS